jgi:hypothetical protein
LLPNLLERFVAEAYPWQDSLWQQLAGRSPACPRLFAAWPGRDRQARTRRTPDGQPAVSASDRPEACGSANPACCSRPAATRTTICWSRKKPTRRSRSTRCVIWSASWCRPRRWAGARWC